MSAGVLVVVALCLWWSWFDPLLHVAMGSTLEFDGI